MTTTTTPATGDAPLSADEVKQRYGVDLTTAEVLRHGLRFVALQMQRKLNTAALSPLLSEVNDFGIGLLAPRDEGRDLDFDALAMATAAPGHYVINQFYARMAIEHWGAENFAPGDVVIYNDPYRGGSHVNDVGAVMPIFADGELIGFAASITHWIDIGGPVPSGFGPNLQRDMYSEGIRLSPRRLYDRGKLVRETLELFTEQTRVPEICINDLQVVHAALKVGADMVEHYVGRYGREAYMGAAQYTLDYCERAVRHALRGIPDGVYEAEDYLDNNMDGEPMRLRCTVRKREDRIEIDYSGSHREEWGGYASQWSDTVTAAHLGLATILDSDDVVPNAGGYRPIHVVAPAGSCFHALPPMSTNAGHTMLLTKALSLVKMALSQARPSLAVGENYDDCGLLAMSGLDERTGVPVPFVTMRVLAGPYGGHALGDGCSYTLVEGGNCVETSVELDELANPILILQREFVADTAGAGRHRGGPATEWLVSPRVDVQTTYQLEQCRFPTKSVLGGHGGNPGSIRVHRGAIDQWASGAELVEAEVVAGVADAATGRPAASEDDPGTEFRLSKNAGVPFGAGDLIAIRTAGGAGCGDPAERSDALVASDVRNGIYTSAARAYGRPDSDRKDD